jgi:hypothetical protein
VPVRVLSSSAPIEPVMYRKPTVRGGGKRLGDFRDEYVRGKVVDG